MILLSFAIFVIPAWLRPRLALGVVLASIPFYEITRFTIAEIPFTFPEVATYTLAVALLLQGKFEARISKSETNSNNPSSKRWMFRSFDHLNFRFVSNFGFRVSDFFRDPWIILPFLWLLIVTISAMYSPAGMRAWGAWKGFFVAPIILFFVVHHLCHSAAASRSRNYESRIKNQGDDSDPIIHYPLFIIHSLAIGAFVVSVVAILQRFWPIGVPYPWNVPGGFRATSVFGYPNAVGLFLGPLVPLFVVGATTSWVSLRGATRRSNPGVDKNEIAALALDSLAMAAWWAIVIVSAIFAIILAKSTGALVALVVVTLMTAVVMIARRQKRLYPKILGREKLGTRVAIGIILAWVLASVAITGALPYKRDLERIQNPIVRKIAFGAWSGSVRLEQYRETWPMLLDHPIRGAGLTGYKQAFAPYHNSTVEIFPYPHNLLLAMWSELGLAGMLVFLAILYQLIRSSLVICAQGASASGGGHWSLVIAIVVILIHGLVDVPYFKNDLSMVFWVIAGLVAAWEHETVTRSSS